MTKLCLLAFVPLLACTSDTDTVVIQLAPEVISSIDGTLGVHAIVLAAREPVKGEAVDVTVEYTDRNGMPHAISPASGMTDNNGAFDATLTGMTWDGTGTVTVAVPGGPEATATFAVLDRTPPKVTIVPPASSQVRIGQNVTVQVHVTDEIGVSQVWFEWNGQNARERSSVVASGSTDTNVGFEFQVSDQATVGSMLTMYALASDLSGNQAAAQPVTVTVTQ
ncbi:MAG TPA: Ig-like domain-containing protein [Kofleriaceae bacterium]